jgi:hypothetical protein
MFKDNSKWLFGYLAYINQPLAKGVYHSNEPNYLWMCIFKTKLGEKIL